MNGFGKTIAVLVFAGLVGAILLGPVLDPAGQNQGPSDESPSPSPTKEAKPPPTPKQSPSSRPDDEEPSRLAEEWPLGCLRRGPRVAGNGLVAAYDRKRVTIGTPEGTVIGSFAGSPPVQWSPSGRHIADGDGHIFSDDGRQRADSPEVDFELFAWSPLTDCYVFTAKRKLWGAGVGSDPVALLRERVLDLAFSPNGRRLALVIGARLWIADLETGRLTRAPGMAVATALFAWTPDGSQLLYGRAPGESVKADGVRVRALHVPDKIQNLPGSFTTTYRAVALDHDDFFTECGDRLVGVVGAGRDSIENKQLQRLPPTGGPLDPLTSLKFAYTSPTCSPDARYIAAIRAPDGGSTDDRRLVLLSPDGSFVDDLTPAQSGADEHPSWGPAGVVFVMRPESGSPQVWFIPEGSTARPTGLTVRAPRGVYGHFDWGRVLDWSGDTPSGAPPGV